MVECLCSMGTELDPVFSPQHSERKGGRKEQDRKKRRRRWRCRVRGGWVAGGRSRLVVCAVLALDWLFRHLDIHGSAGRPSASN